MTPRLLIISLIISLAAAASSLKYTPSLPQADKPIYSYLYQLSIPQQLTVSTFRLKDNFEDYKYRWVKVNSDENVQVFANYGYAGGFTCKYDKKKNSNLIPLYHLTSQKLGDAYSTDPLEVKKFKKEGYSFVGTFGYLLKSCDGNSVPLYRLDISFLNPTYPKFYYYQKEITDGIEYVKLGCMCTPKTPFTLPTDVIDVEISPFSVNQAEFTSKASLFSIIEASASTQAANSVNSIDVAKYTPKSVNRKAQISQPDKPIYQYTGIYQRDLTSTYFFLALTVGLKYELNFAIYFTKTFIIAYLDAIYRNIWTCKPNKHSSFVQLYQLVDQNRQEIVATSRDDITSLQADGYKIKSIMGKVYKTCNEVIGTVPLYRIDNGPVEIGFRFEYSTVESASAILLGCFCTNNKFKPPPATLPAA